MKSTYFCFCLAHRCRVCRPGPPEKIQFFHSWCVPRHLKLKTKHLRYCDSKKLPNHYTTQVFHFGFLSLKVEASNFSPFFWDGTKVKILSETKEFHGSFEVVKKHWVPKIGIFHPLFCLGMLGKSTSYSTGTEPLSSCFWAN